MARQTRVRPCQLGNPARRPGRGVDNLRDRGFTLLEVLLAVAVLGVLIGLLDQGLSYALRVTAIQARATGPGSDMPVVEAALRRMISKADPGVFPEPASMKGTAASLTMVTEVAGAEGAPRRIDAMLFARDGAMRLRFAAHRHVEPFGPGAPTVETVLLGGVTGLAFDYADAKTGTWRPNWTAEILPALVRIQLEFANGAERWPPIIVATRLEAPGQ